mgnify:FL=1|jgi:hypothetical protein|tara:strand:- start:10648 stop:11634 length:987 start_codon:yes stop_codon:yes gene_type:complete
MNITIARLRSNVKYLGPLETVLDSFFENYIKWMRDHPEHNYDTYNVSFENKRPKRTPETIEWADCIVIPSDSEFRYHGELQMNPKDLATSNEHMAKIVPHFEGKHVIMFCSDRADTEELYVNEVFKGINLKSFTKIDEIDFSGNIHGMKYHFINTLKNPLAEMVGSSKTHDFGYWGRMKHGHDREKTIRQIYRSDLSCQLIGGMPSGVERKSKWIKDWKVLYPLLEGCRETLCFNWLDETATTSRYVEALAIGIVPLVWRNYDCNNTYRINKWQRCYTFEEFLEKSLELRDDSFREAKLEEYRNNYAEVHLTEEGYYEEFARRMDNAF